MAKKKNRGKKTGGAKPGGVAVNGSSGSSATLTEEAASTAVAAGSLELLAKEPNVATATQTIKQDESLFVKEFEIKAKEVIESLPKEPEVVEKVVEVEKIVEKVVEKIVEDPELRARVEELSKENESLKTQIGTVGTPTLDTDDSQHQEEVNSLQEKVLHYQTVLADTEALLKSLQASVEGEESAWQKKMVEKDDTLKQVTVDKANLELQVKQLEATIENVKQAEEMQSQLKVIQEQLQKEEKEKTVLQEELQKAQEQLTQTATQGVSEASEGAELAELRGENSKLYALVTVGQETSQQQEQLIQQLQEELTATKSVPASTNGPASIECQEEDNTSQAETASMVSASSSSVTNISITEDSDAPKKVKKKKKGFLGKLIGKSSSP